MNIRELLNENMIEIGAEISSKDEALERLVMLQQTGGCVRNIYALRRELWEREQMGNSAVSARIAIPDVVHSGAVKTAVSVITVKSGVDYGAPDKRPVKLIFLITGRNDANEHFEVKARLMRLLSDPGFTARLCAAKSKEEFMELIGERERIRFPQISK